MKLIKRITQGNQTLEHHTYVDSFGIKRDSFELIETDEKGVRTLIPFLPDVKVKLHSRKSNILDATDTYTEEDYERMLFTNTDKTTE